MIRTLVIGYGYWGRVMTRNLLEHDDFFVAGVCDPDAEALRTAARKNLETFHTIEDAFDRGRAQLVVIATPIGTQTSIAYDALRRHHHVMIAKPGPRTANEAESLIRLANERRRVICVDYTLTISRRFAETRERAEHATLLSCVRSSHGSRSSAHIFDDMGIHDLSLVQAYDPIADWYVTDAGVLDDMGFISLVSSRHTQAKIVLRRGADDETRRVFTAHGSHRVETWDQLDEEDPPLVKIRLDWLADQIRTDQPGNVIEILRSTRLLESAHAASDRSYLA